MNKKVSSGLLMYKFVDGKLKVFIAHNGGPFFKDKDDGYWGIPKGEVKKGEELLNAALREFKEETGISVDRNKKFIELGNVVYKNGKTVYAWAFEGDWSGLLMGTSFVDMSYKGKRIKFPEIDRADFFDVEAARKKMMPPQFEFVKRLEEILKRVQ